MLQIYDIVWRPCSVDIIGYKITAIINYGGFVHYRAKSIDKVGACGIIEVVLFCKDNHIRFVELIDEENIPYASGLQDFVEGEYYKSKEEAKKVYYQRALLSQSTYMEECKRRYEDSVKRYKEIQTLLNTFLQ